MAIPYPFFRALFRPVSFSSVFLQWNNNSTQNNELFCKLLMNGISMSNYDYNATIHNLLKVVLEWTRVLITSVTNDVNLALIEM